MYEIVYFNCTLVLYNIDGTYDYKEGKTYGKIIDEDLDNAPKRILKKETNVDNIYLEQLYTFGNVDRDPRMRIVSTSYIALVDKNKIDTTIIVSTSYIALVDKNKIDTTINENASWFDVMLIEEKNNIVEISLSNGIDNINFSIEKKLKELTTDRYSFHIKENKSIAFDHPKVILAGIERLKNKIEYTDIVFNMMPGLFTLGELQQVYEVILGKKLLDPDFRRIIKDKVEKTNKMKTGGGHRPSVLFRYKRK